MIDAVEAWLTATQDRPFLVLASHMGLFIAVAMWLGQRLIRRYDYERDAIRSRYMKRSLDKR